jgi:hypothetical protein
MGKKSGSGSGMNNPDHISESLETIFWVKIRQFFDMDPRSVVRDKTKFGSGIREGKKSDPQRWLQQNGAGGSNHCACATNCTVGTLT